MEHVNFINYSTFSNGYGLLKIEDIIKINKKNNSKYAVITDHMTCLGFADFNYECIKNNLTPIFGLSVKVKGLEGNFIFIARNENGLKSLYNIVSEKSIDENGFDFIEFEKLKNICNDLILITGNSESVLGKSFYSNSLNHTFSELSKVFNNKEKNNLLVLDVQKNFSHDKHFELEYQIAKLASQTKTNIIATSTNRMMKESHYILLEQKFINQFKIKDSNFSLENLGLNRNDFAKTISYINSNFFSKNIKDVSKFISTTVDLTNQFITPFNLFKEPEFPKSKKYSSLKEVLLNKWQSFLKKIPEDKRSVYKERIKHELSIIEKLKMEDYFLTFLSMAESAINNDIAFTIRGSGSGSLVNYVLGISSIDPVKNNLLFERFLNLTRAEQGDLPDIDFDTSDNKFVMQALELEYGKDHIAQLMNFDTIQKATVSLNFVKKSLLIEKNRNLDSINETFDLINNTFYDIKKIKTLSEEIKNNVALQNLYSSNKKVKFIIDSALTTERQVISKKRNPASVVLTEDNIKNHISITYNPDSFVQNIAEVSSTYVENMGFIKLDILSNHIIGYNLNAYKSLLNKEKLYDDNYDDKNVFNLFNDGFTFSLYQIKDIGRNIAQRMKINNFDDIVVLMGLIRPGVPKMEIESYLATKNNNNNTQIQYPIKSLGTILDNTYGVIIFEEQLMKIAQIIGGLTVDESDSLRRVIKSYSKNKNQEIINTYREKFLENGSKKGYTYEQLNQTFDKIESKKEGYMFNEAHARVYADICYKQAYIKANFPGEYISFYIKNMNDKKQYIDELIKRGLYINCPNINEAGTYNKSVLFNNNMKGILPSINIVNNDFIQIIINERQKKPFSSYFEFIDRTLNNYLLKNNLNVFSIHNISDSKIINEYKNNIEKLINTGFFDVFNKEKDDINPLVFRNIIYNSTNKAIDFALNPYIQDDFIYAEPDDFVDFKSYIEKEENILGFSPSKILYQSNQKKRHNFRP